MSDTPVSTPKRKETAAGAGLDYTGIAVEICKYAESGKKVCHFHYDFRLPTADSQS